MSTKSNLRSSQPELQDTSEGGGAPACWPNTTLLRGHEWENFALGYEWENFALGF